MGYIRSLQTNAIVKALAVIEKDKAANMLQSLLVRRETSFLTVYALALDDAVHAFGNAIIGGFHSSTVCRGQSDG